jgi:hypothetical protein
VPRSWRLLAAAEEAPEPVEVEFVEPEAEDTDESAVPEPVEAQLAAAGAGKDADIFAVVMVGPAVPLAWWCWKLPSSKWFGSSLIVPNLSPLINMAKLTRMHEIF